MTDIILVYIFSNKIFYIYSPIFGRVVAIYNSMYIFYEYFESVQ